MAELIGNAQKCGDISCICDGSCEESKPVVNISNMTKLLAFDAYEDLPPREKEIVDLCSNLAQLLVAKNRDYGDSFSKGYQKRGLLGAVVRMEDKMGRLDTLLELDPGDKPNVNESVADTLLDLSGYALLSYGEEVRKNERA